MNWTGEVDGVYVPMQYDLRDDPWRMLVACMLMNRAGGLQAKRALADIEDLDEELIMHLGLKYTFTTLEAAFMPCGFQHQRAKRVLLFTVDWVRAVFREGGTPSVSAVAEMHGIGPYAIDSYKIFVMHEFVDAPADHVLSAFVHSELFARFAQHGHL